MPTLTISNLSTEEKKELANKLLDRWEEIEDSGTAEMAAYHIACEQLHINPDDGWSLLVLIGKPVIS